jgi:hypothetical protein
MTDVRKPGKLVVGKLYFHRSALSRVDQSIRKRVLAAQRREPEWKWDIARVDIKGGRVALIQSPDWDTADEPTVGAMIVLDGRTVKRRPPTAMIYHHKWTFVSDDYTGFDVEASKARSSAWESLDPPVNKRKIGHRRHWEEAVVSRLALIRDS